MNEKHGNDCPTPQLERGQTTNDWIAICPHHELAGQGSTQEAAKKSLTSVLTNYRAYMNHT